MAAGHFQGRRLGDVPGALGSTGFIEGVLVYLENGIAVALSWVGACTLVHVRFASLKGAVMAKALRYPCQDGLFPFLEGLAGRSLSVTLLRLIKN